MSYAVLVDLVRCIGCRSCQVACKSWNDKSAVETVNRGAYDNPLTVSADTWTVVRFTEVQQENQFHWVFNKIQCMHCMEPPCASVCTVGALHKSEMGPVTYDLDRCIGCRYCLYACPFGIPSFQWNERLSLISKCNFCEDRLEAGLEPACVKTCPPEALAFGERDELITTARARIAASPDRYVNHVYGEYENGGTSFMYLSAVPFDLLGFPVLGKHPLTSASESIMGTTPTAAIAAVAALGGFYWLTKRQEEPEDADSGEEE